MVDEEEIAFHIYQSNVVRTPRGCDVIVATPLCLVRLVFYTSTPSYFHNNSLHSAPSYRRTLIAYNAQHELLQAYA